MGPILLSGWSVLVEIRAFSWVKCLLLFQLYGHFTGCLPVYLPSFYQLTWLSYITLPSVLYRNPSFTAFLSSSNTSILRWAYIPLSLLYSLLTVPVAILFVLRYLTIHLVRLTRRYWAILFVLSSCTSRNITTSTGYGPRLSTTLEQKINPYTSR